MANQYGLDGISFEERLEWFHKHQNNMDIMRYKAKDKFRFISAIMAYENAVEGVPSGHLVGFDACASGPQIMSTIMGDPIGAKNTGLIGDERMDIYDVAIETISMLLGKPNAYEKKDVKYVLMP